MSQPLAAAHPLASAPVPLAAVHVDCARRLMAERRLREERFGRLHGMIADPGWDMLLDLFVAQSENRSTSVSSACIAARAPTTTALRYLELLEREGLIERQSDRYDRRRSFVHLSARGARELTAYLSALCE